MIKEEMIHNLSPSNYEIMKIVWEQDEVTVNDVHKEIVQQRQKHIRRSSVQVQMTRLEEYGWLKHRQEGKTFHYSATRAQAPTRAGILRDIKERVFGGSTHELVKCLLDDRHTSAGEIRKLRGILSQYEEEE